MVELPSRVRLGGEVHHLAFVVRVSAFRRDGGALATGVDGEGVLACIFKWVRLIVHTVGRCNIATLEVTLGVTGTVTVLVGDGEAKPAIASDHLHVYTVYCTMRFEGLISQSTYAMPV